VIQESITISSNLQVALFQRMQHTVLKILKTTYVMAQVLNDTFVEEIRDLHLEKLVKSKATGASYEFFNIYIFNIHSSFAFIYWTPQLDSATGLRR
jgi:hypothetical protein